MKTDYNYKYLIDTLTVAIEETDEYDFEKLYNSLEDMPPYNTIIGMQSSPVRAEEHTISLLINRFFQVAMFKQFSVLLGYTTKQINLLVTEDDKAISIDKVAKFIKQVMDQFKNINSNIDLSNIGNFQTDEESMELIKDLLLKMDNRDAVIRFLDELMVEANK